MIYTNENGKCEPQTAYSFMMSYPPKEEPVLKPCPFCGGEAELRSEIDNRDETYAIHCRTCHMHFTKFVWRSYDEIDVVKEWNRRMKNDNKI